MYITILPFLELAIQVREKIIENRPDLKLRLDTKNDPFHILENGNVYYEFDLKYNSDKKFKPVPCYTYPKNSFEFTDFFNTAENILEYPDIPSAVFIDPDNVAYKSFLIKFNDIYSSFGAEVCQWLIMYQYFKPFAIQNKYQVTRGVAKRILDYFTELGFIKKNRDGWNVNKETEKTIYNKMIEFDLAKQNMFSQRDEQETNEEEDNKEDNGEEDNRIEVVIKGKKLQKNKKK